MFIVINIYLPFPITDFPVYQIFHAYISSLMHADTLSIFPSMMSMSDLLFSLFTHTGTRTSHSANHDTIQCTTLQHHTLNPYNAEATFIQSRRMQRFSKIIETLSSWYSLNSPRGVLSGEYPYAKVCHFSGFLHHFVLDKLATSSIRVNTLIYTFLYPSYTSALVATLSMYEMCIDHLLCLTTAQSL